MLTESAPILDAIYGRRAVRAFEPAIIPPSLREQILRAACVAPSSFNTQPWRFYWIESEAMRNTAAKLCMSQLPARTASALVVAVSDIGSWKSTQQEQLEWMRSSGFTAEEVSKYEKRAKLSKWFFRQGWFGTLGAIKWAILRFLNLWKIIGMVPVSRRGLFQWATRSTALACENLMIAAEALGLNTCPMEGFDGRRLGRFLNLSPRYDQIVMVIAIGRKSPGNIEQPQHRRPMEATVSIL